MEVGMIEEILMNVEMVIYLIVQMMVIVALKLG